MEEQTTLILSALSTLDHNHLSKLNATVVSLTRDNHRRLAAILSSQSLFSLTFHHLHSLSLHQKNLLVSSYLLSSLRHLTLPFHRRRTAISAINNRELDAVLLLLFLCDTHQDEPAVLRRTSAGAGDGPGWREALIGVYVDKLLRFESHIGGGVLAPFVETAARCWKFTGSMGGGGNEKEGRNFATSPAVVVALPSVEVSGSGGACAICREEMNVGRDVCELPCQHLFHWLCILLWLKKRNTCPCCRYRLPTDDVYGEIERLWLILIQTGRGLDVEHVSFF